MDFILWMSLGTFFGLFIMGLFNATAYDKGFGDGRREGYRDGYDNGADLGRYDPQTRQD